MIFGRKGRKGDTSEEEDIILDDEFDEQADDDDVDEPIESDEEQPDYRDNGPFDYEEVDLSDDDVARADFGSLIVTPLGDDMVFQPVPDQNTGQVVILLAHHGRSAIELMLLAAPTGGGLAAEVFENLSEEVKTTLNGNAIPLEGPFGPELRLVLPMTGPEGEQGFQVSRVWLVEGPRWLLRARLLGEAALADGEAAPADAFAEFFRNIVVRRDDEPRVPGEPIPMAPPMQDVQG